MRKIIGQGLVAIGVFVFSGSLKADSLYLSSAAPAEVVTVSAPTLDPSVNGSFESGVLNWVNLSVVPYQSIQSFCIDINHDIAIGGIYSYAVGAAVNGSSDGNDPLLSDPKVVDAIYALWNLHGLADLTQFSNADANSFQVALWDILYNGGSKTGTGPVTIGGADPTGQQHVQTGFDWANEAVTLANDPNTNPSILSGNYLSTMIFDVNGQQQIYIGNPAGAPVPTPLPSALGGGLVLLGVVGALKWRGRSAGAARV